MTNAALGFAALLLTLSSGDAFAMGAKPLPTPAPTPTQPAPAPSPVSQQAKPYRYMELARVSVPSFFLPNGNRADYNLDLNTLLQSQINATRYLRTVAPNTEAPPRLLITGGITSFEADVMGANLKIGFNKGGALLPGQNISGEVTLKVSALSMDFLIYDRVHKTTRLSSTSDQTLSKLNITAKVNLANYDGSVNLFYQEVVAKAVAQVAADALKRIEDRTDFDNLYWAMPIVGRDLDQNFIGFNAGAADNVKVGDVFSIYSACEPAAEAAGNCFSRFLSDVRVYQVGQGTAQAKPFTDKDFLSQVQVGDRVEVKPNVSSTR